MELSKSQKKIARMLIDRALQRECADFHSVLKSMPDASGGESPHETYRNLYGQIRKFDKHIARTYDNLTGSRYFNTVFILYYNGVLTEKDIGLFDGEVNAEFVKLKKEWDKFDL